MMRYVPIAAALMAALTTSVAIADEWKPCTITWDTAAHDGQLLELVDGEPGLLQFERTVSVFISGEHVLFPSKGRPETLKMNDTRISISPGAYEKSALNFNASEGAISRNSYLVMLDDGGDVQDVVHYELEGVLICD